MEEAIQGGFIKGFQSVKVELACKDTIGDVLGHFGILE